jgi:hypothetical protein
VHVVNKSSSFLRPKPGSLDRDQAEALAIQGLTFLAGDAARLSRFLGLTGLEPGRLREEARSPRFLAAVLDHFLGDESLLLVFCGEHGVDPALVEPARRLMAQDPAPEHTKEGRR